MSAATKCDVCGNLVEQQYAVYFDVHEGGTDDPNEGHWRGRAVCHRCWNNPLRTTLLLICRGLRLRQPTKGREQWTTKPHTFC